MMMNMTKIAPQSLVAKCKKVENSWIYENHPMAHVFQQANRTGGLRHHSLDFFSLEKLTFPNWPRSRFYERTISLRFLGIILRVFRLEVPYTMFTLPNQFKSTFARGGGGGGVKNVSRGDCE
jgi:hypothetical protein